MKHKRQDGFELIFIIILLAVIGIVALVFVKGPGRKIFSSDNSPVCTADSRLTVSPINLSELPNVTPLGNINAPVGHIFPSDHVGLSIPRANSEPNSQATLATNIVAPGKVTAYGLKQTTYYQNGKLLLTDYSINFRLCRNVTFYFGHMQHISAALNRLTQTTKGDCSDRSQGTSRFTECNYDISYVTAPGEQLGSAGGPGATVAGIDFGLTDKNKPRLAFIRQKGQPESSLYGQCALDYFSSPLRAQLYAKLPPKANPPCGQIMQDKPGTLQGDWYKQGGDPGVWGQQLALLHSNVDASVGVVSIGGTISGAGNFNFSPMHSGLVNREPSEVTASHETYCYQGETLGNAQAGPGQTTGRVLLQLIDSTTLKAEHQAGNCASPFALQNPTTYER